VLGSAPLALPGRDLINLGFLSLCGAGLAAFVDPSLFSSLPFDAASDPEFVRTAALATVSAVSGLLGLHLTASIGGADMPVVITVLNSYSGWALVAEGFLLKTPLLTEVGALIGFSGAILTLIMCEAMNRSVVSVILGGAGTKAKPKGDAGPAQIQEGEITTVPTSGLMEAVEEAKSVIIVPGYGLAVAQAQFSLAEIVTSLIKAGKKVRARAQGRSALMRATFCSARSSESGARAKQVRRRCSTAAEAGKRGGASEASARKAYQSAAEAGLPSERSEGVSFCGGSGQNLGLSGGDPQNPPYGRRGRTCAWPHMCSAAHVLGRTCARPHMHVMCSAAHVMRSAAHLLPRWV
jgi:hypothetical protein